MHRGIICGAFFIATFGRFLIFVKRIVYPVSYRITVGIVFRIPHSVPRRITVGIVMVVADVVSHAGTVVVVVSVLYAITERIAVSVVIYSTRNRRKLISAIARIVIVV